MIGRVIAWSIRNRAAVMLAALLFLIGGVWAAWTTPIDAIPELSETQLLVYSPWPGHVPEDVDAYVTHPVSVVLQGLEGVRTIRASSEFGYSLIHLIFDDATDLRSAREVVSNRLGTSSMELPAGVNPTLAPDGPATGQIFWYVLEGKGRDLGELRSIHDARVKNQLATVPGVAEVAAVGGFPVEIRVEIDPLLLVEFDLGIDDLRGQVEEALRPLGAEAVQGGNAEFWLRAVGPVRASTSALDAPEAISLLQSLVIGRRDGLPIRLEDVARVFQAPGPRRGVLEMDGNEVVGGVVMMANGHNPLDVTQRIKQKMIALRPSLPDGVRLVTAYDRTPLIHGAIATVTQSLLEAIVTATLCVVLVLRHWRSSLVIALTLPLSVVGSFGCMWLLRQLDWIDVQTNIMSLAGIVISIGVLVDSSIVMIENVMHHLRERFGDQPVGGDVRPIVERACQQVGRPLFFSVVIMLISFLPVFALGGLEGKMFRPLAMAKSLALLTAAVLAISLVPALCSCLIRGRICPERDSWVVRGVMDVYRPMLAFFMRRPAGLLWFTSLVLIFGIGPLRRAWVSAGVLALGLIAVACTARRWWSGVVFCSLLLVSAFYAARQLPPLQSEFVAPLDEGTVMDMPITVPRASVAQAADDLKARDMLLCRFPEVGMVMGKAGRAETAADPAPIDMIETMVSFLPVSEWPRRHVEASLVRKLADGMLEELQRDGLLEFDGTIDRAGMVWEVAEAAHRDLDLSLREYAYQRRRDLLSDLAQELPLAAARRLTEDAIPAAGDQGTLREAFAIQIAAKVSDDLRHSLAQLTDEVAVAELQQSLNIALEAALRDASGKGGPLELSGAESQGARLRSELRSTRGRLSTAHRREVDRELVERARLALPRLLLERLLQRAVTIHDRSLAAEFARWRNFRNTPPQGRSVGKSHHGAANYEPPRFDPTPKIDAICERFSAGWLGRLPLRVKTRAELVGFDGELDRAVQMPGWTNVWTMPIQNRVDMLATGVNTTVGVRVLGNNLDDVVSASQSIADVLRDVSGAVNVIADPVRGKAYIDVDVWRKRDMDRGIPVAELQQLVELVMGGRVVATLQAGRERLPVRLAMATGPRSDLESLRRIPVRSAASAAGRADSIDPTQSSDLPGSADPGASALETQLLTLGDLVRIEYREGPATIKSENGLLRNYVRLNVQGRDVLDFVAEARRRVASAVRLPDGVFVEWTGQFEHQVRAKRTLWIVGPLVLLLILVILFATFKDVADTLLIVPAVIGALAGGLVAQSWMGHRLSVTVAIGYLACFGMAASTGIIMLVYLRDAVERGGGIGGMTLGQLRRAILNGATHRLRPKLLTEATTILGLAPMLWASGIGSEVIQTMAVPVFGGILVADEVIDLLLPVMFYWTRRGRWIRQRRGEAAANSDIVRSDAVE
jgi:Cu(I)/Ag(I) efflux system membrane protein CusA/SilA